MTVSSTVRRIGPFNGNDVATDFPFTIKVFAAADIELTHTDTEGAQTVLVLDSDYSVALNADQDNNPGGTITYPMAGAPLPTGESINGITVLAYAQPTDISNLGNFLPQVLEDAFDRQTMLSQQLDERLDRAYLVPVGETADDLPTAEGLAAVSAIADETIAVAGIAADVTAVAGIAADVTTVAANTADINTVAGMGTDLTAVADIAGDVATLIANITAIETVADNIDSVADAAAAAAVSGVYPSTAASNVPRGLTQASVGAITAGSGGTNGTFALAWSAGNFSINPTGTFTVAGGALTAVTITGPGLYIGASPTVPTPSFAASAGLGGGAAVALTAQFLITSGQGYWVQSSDFLTLDRYKNVSGVATSDTANVDSILTETGEDQYMRQRVSAGVEAYPGTPAASHPVDADHSLDYFPNINRTEDDPLNLVRFVRGAATSSLTLLTSGVTITRNYGTGPQGAQTSIRAVSTTLGAYILTQHANYPAGTYTVTLDIKSAGGANTVFVGANSTINSKSVDATWQPISQTVVHTSGTLTINWLNRNSGPAFDLEIDNLRLHPGASDLGVDEADGDLFMGQAAGLPTNPDLSTFEYYVDGVIPLSGGRATRTELTVIASVKVPTAPGGSVFNVLSEASDYAIGITAAGCVTGFTSGTSQLPPYAKVAGQGWKIVALKAGAAGRKVFVDGAPVADLTTAYAGATGAYLSIKPTLLPSDSRMAPVAVYATAMTDRAISRACKRMAQRLAASGKTINLAQWALYAFGDSITSPSTSYAGLVFTDNPTYLGAIPAFSGDTLTGQLAIIDRHLSAWEGMVANGQVPVVSLLIGRNDSAAMIASPSTYYARLVKAWKLIRDTGAKLIVCTILPSTAASYNTARNAVNTLIRADDSLYDELCDFDTTTMGADAAAADVAKYSDGTHPTAAGQLLLQVPYEAAVDAILTRV